MKKELRASIQGPASPYTFEYEIYDPENLLATGQHITSLKVNIFNIESYIYGQGDELIELWFNDRNMIQDISNNSLTEGRIIGSLNEFEYVSESKPTTLTI